MQRRSFLAAPAALLASKAFAQTPARTLRVVMHSDLKIIDPIWTTAYIVRNHGYMIYDTLFALDGKLEPRPQMVESWTTSDDGLVWTFRLRDRLKWNDGPPVTSADVLPSLKRWMDKDAVGGLLAKAMKEMTAPDERTFRIALKEPFSLILKALAKPASVPLFVMPGRVAETPVNQQISDTTGCGPFVFKRDEWKPGEKVVYVRNPDYVPRAEPPSGLAGGKVAKLERVEWLSIADMQTAINALISGEIDMIEAPSHDLLPVLEKDRDIEIVIPDTLGNTYLLRFNWKQPPTSDLRIRRAAELALRQDDFLKAVIGDPRYYKVCRAMFGCGTPFENAAGMDGILQGDFEGSRKLLKEAGYDGTPIVLLQSTDLAVLTNLAPVAKGLLERGGFKVDMQSMDWQTLVARRAKKTAPSEGGWNIAMTAASAVLLADPIVNHYTETTGDRAQFGWPTDAEIEKLRQEFLHQTDPAKQRQIAEAVQKRVMDLGVTVPLGQYVQPMARRKGVKGNIPSPVTVFWNVEKA
ncbi:ABC transporter substrate-binding protein [Enhydrobacter sp.]|jgi:peptide/nickel transport system substrate-binding protein|uniref:ABC transporter substrate-binding protein n=1 Tax=Enhydrobacter sp. TaxID=1894999 RepID=UPI002630CA37|nr:ABC transporter substrate-binding protein [Enhydrobacter sp.]WIM14402.1 MAG: ABC transporter, substrate-binding protein (cluster 5, nickel/peptides/opines) [Enhydrobacter sp.]